MNNILGSLEPSYCIRLAGYRSTGSLAAAEFGQRWHTAAAAAPKGLVYRELCAAMPSWNQQIEKEIQVPNPYAFIDYAVLRTPDDMAALGEVAVPDMVGRYSVFLRLVNSALAQDAEVVLFNLFSLTGPPELEASFAEAWRPRGIWQQQQPGFCSATLHRRLSPTGAEPAAFNRAEWRNVADYAATLPGFERTFPREQRMRQSGEPTVPPPVRSHLGLFRRVAAVP